jgi:hypothetical protein
MVGHEIEHEFQAALLEPLAQPGEGGVSAKVSVDGVAGDGEAGAGDVLVAEVGKGLVKLLAPLRIAA